VETFHSPDVVLLWLATMTIFWMAFSWAKSKLDFLPPIDVLSLEPGACRSMTYFPSFSPQGRAMAKTKFQPVVPSVLLEVDVCDDDVVEVGHASMVTNLTRLIHLGDNDCRRHPLMKKNKWKGRSWSCRAVAVDQSHPVIVVCR
jgi:hypothetical protein